MGDQDVRSSLEGEERRSFTQSVLTDVRALERMIQEGQIEEGRRRIGAEQEFFLIDQSWHPKPCALELLDLLDDDHFTTELALFNLEANLDPVEFGGSCLHALETQLLTLLDRAAGAAAVCNARILLTGILPTIRKSDLSIENITPNPRYFALNDALRSLRGNDYEFRIRGADELLVKHDSCMVESCNASFQAHFQVGAQEFPRLYNIAQVVAAPVMAAACNSPLLFGRRLWNETRIALFEQSVDTRSSGHDLREITPRVSFGRGWVRESVLEIFREDIARFRALLGTEFEEDPLAMLDAGEVPRLRALCLHNSTVYRWNRACYGVTAGKPHLRIENRILPSGPTPVDEVANAALWFGLLSGMAALHDDVSRLMDFDDADQNFHAAAQRGLNSQFTWIDGETVPARQLLSERLLPLATNGLEEAGIDGKDIDRYIGVVRDRIGAGLTGSAWMLKSFHGLRELGTPGERLNAITAAAHAQQLSGTPVSKWELARLEEAGGFKHNYLRVEHFMTTDLFTVHADDAIDLAANLMDWERIRHILVEDQEHRLVGLVSYRSLIRHLGNAVARDLSRAVAVAEIMKPAEALLTVSPSTTTLEAIEFMRQNRVACLPVVNAGRLVGVVTERDFLDISAALLEERLRD